MCLSSSRGEWCFRVAVTFLSNNVLNLDEKGMGELTAISFTFVELIPVGCDFSIFSGITRILDMLVIMEVDCQIVKILFDEMTN